MEQRIYRSSIDPMLLAQQLGDEWDQGETVAQVLEGDEGLIVQIGQRTNGFFSDEPSNALTVAIELIDDGVRVTLGEQEWYRDGGGRIMVGGLIGFFPFFFTWPLRGGRGEPVSSQLSEQVWQSIERYAAPSDAAVGTAPQPTAQPSAATGETTRLSTERCPACSTTNPIGAERCRECGTFLQARNCPQCGVSNPATANFCMRCGSALDLARTAGN